MIMKPQIKQKMLVGTLALSTLIVSAGTSMANLALPSISAEFSLSFSNVRWVVLSYLLATTLFGLAVGRLGDLNGRRNVLLWGGAMFSTGSLVAAYSFSFPGLIVGRVVQGIGAAALAVLPMAIVADALSHQKMGRVIGLLATMSAFGTAAGPSIGGVLIGEYGWRSVFSAMTALGVGTLLLVITFVQLGSGSSKSAQEITFFDSIHSFYSKSSFRTHLFANLAISAVMASTLIVGPFYLTHALHLDPRHMGLVMSAGPITSILAGTLSGYAVDRFGFRLFKFGLVLSLIGTVSFIFLPMHFGSLGFVLSAIILSLGYQLFLSANSNSFMKKARPEQRGIAAGTLNLSRNMGLITGTYLLGGIFDFFAKGTGLSAAPEKTISDGLQVAFLIATFMIAALLFIELKHQKRRTNENGFVN